MNKKVKLVALTLITIFTLAGVACEKGARKESSIIPSELSSTLENRTIELNRNTLELDRFGEAKLFAKIQGQGDLEWLSSNENVVKVNEGKLEPAGVGVALITVKFAGTDIFDSCTVTVVEATELPALILDKASVSLLKGGSLTVTPKVTYRGKEINENIIYTWSMNDETIASISSGIIKGIKTGQTKLTVKGEWKGETLEKTICVDVKADASVTVKDSENNNIRSVTLRSSLPNGTDSSYINKIQLFATPYEKGKEVLGKIDWSIFSGECITLENGLITALKTGEAVVRAEYITMEQDKVYNDVLVCVVLPDINSDIVLELDKTQPEVLFDFSALSEEEIIGMKFGEADIMEGNQINKDWLALQQAGDFKVQILTASIIYNVKLTVFSSYIKTDLGDSEQLLILNNNTREDLGGIWKTSDENDKDIIGDTTNVYKYELKDGIGVGNPFSYRVEITNNYFLKYPDNKDYMVLNAFLPQGSPGVSGWGKGQGDIWFDWIPDKEIASNKGFYIGEDGVKTNILRVGEWMKIVIPIGKLGINRFAFLSPGGKDDSYYIKDMRLYSQKWWNTMYMSCKLSEIVLNHEESHEILFDDLNLYVGEKEASFVSEITLSGGDDSVVTIDGKIVTAKGAGSTKVSVNIRIEKNLLTTVVNVVVAQVVKPVNINRLTDKILSSDEIKGNILKIECEGEIISESADISTWLNGLPECSLGVVKKAITVTTNQNYYNVEVQVIDTKDYINDSIFNVISNGGASALWTKTNTFEGESNVYHYNSAKEDGTASGINIWNSRVEFNNAKLYSKYKYMAAEIYLSKGSSFGFFFGQSGGGIYVLKEGTLIGESAAYSYAFDSQGNKLENFKEGQWMTIIVPTSIIIQQRCAFGQKDGEVFDYYVGEMTLYTQENFENCFNISKLISKVVFNKKDISLLNFINNNCSMVWTKGKKILF